MKEIGIVITATNAYTPLGINFIKRFNQYYIGDNKIKFHLFSDINPKIYLPSNLNIEYNYRSNENRVDGNNLRFECTSSLMDSTSDYLYWFDADTNIYKEFNDDWFLGEMVAGQHFFDQTKMKNVKNYERNEKSSAYIPLDTKLPETYYYGAFWGGLKYNVVAFCEAIINYRNIDKNNKYIPPYNEKYINKYFHYNRPTKIVKNVDFEFLISAKCGIDDIRNTNKNMDKILNDLLINKNKLTNIVNGVVIT